MTRKVLILTPITPDKTSAGGRFVQRLLDTLGPQGAVVALIGSEKGQIPPQFETIKLAVPPAPTVNRTSTAMSSAEETIYWLFRQRMLQKLSDLTPKLTTFAAKNHVGHLVALLDHPATVWLTKKIIEAMGIRYSTFTSELPETVLHSAGYDSRSKSQIFREYVQVLKAAQANAFASESMARHHQEKYSIKAIGLSIPTENRQAATNHYQNLDGKIRVGSLLNPRFIAATQSFITGCQEIGWQFQGKELELKLIGSAAGVPLRFGGKPAQIEILGGLAEEEKIAALAECTFNFLPFWTETQFAQSARLCLPDDFPLYAGAGRPLLVNTLAPSLIEDTIKAFSLGTSVQSCGEKLLIPALDTVMRTAQSDAATDNFRRLGQELFSERQLSAAIRDLLPSSYIEKNSTA